MKIFTDPEWVDAPASVLVIADRCACGATAIRTHWKDAEYTSILPCSDACKSIADTRNSWFEIYGQEIKMYAITYYISDIAERIHLTHSSFWSLFLTPSYSFGEWLEDTIDTWTTW